MLDFEIIFVIFTNVIALQLLLASAQSGPPKSAEGNYQNVAHHDYGADGVCEERERVGDEDSHDPCVCARGRRDGRAQQHQEQHEEEGDELAYGVQDAEHREVGQEAGVLESGGNSAI